MPFFSKRVFVCLWAMLFLHPAFATGKLKDVQQGMSDVLITTKIDAKLAEKAKVNPLKLKVSTHQGVVTLNGSVQDRAHFVEVLRLVKETKGVKGVDIENVKIRSANMPITDAYITAKVEAAILKAKVFDDESIPLVGLSAKTVNGAVTLSGTVKNQASVAKIVKRVYAVRGVKLVIPNLTVAATK